MTSRASTTGLRVTSGGTDAAVLITGGAGFIGTNIAHRLLSRGTPVIVLDNLSRAGVERNLRWLCETHGRLVRPCVADIRDTAAVLQAVSAARQVIHLAAQVAVTTSVADPVLDFEVNAAGTLNVLDAVRAQDDPPPLLFTSTNKVYGCLDDIALQRVGRRYEPVDPRLRERGLDETRRIDFRSPYGCSKGAADQYVLDFARTYGLPAAVFRMSCVYGPHQFGTEDQGWVAHFLRRLLNRELITLYGDGCQVRDILYVDDLVDAVELAFHNMEAAAGHAFNIGGGPAGTVSLLELIEYIAGLAGVPASIEHGPWRADDQKYYASDLTRFSTLTGWRPRHGLPDGMRRLCAWLRASPDPYAAPDRTAWPAPVPGPAAAAAGDR